METDNDFMLQPSRSRTSLKTWAYSTSQPVPTLLEDASVSKCPIARIVNGTKDLLGKFGAQAFDYTPFSAPNYQASHLIPQKPQYAGPISCACQLVEGSDIP